VRAGVLPGLFCATLAGQRSALTQNSATPAAAASSCSAEKPAASGPEAATFLRFLARSRARSFAYVLRWSALLAFAAARTFATSLVSLPLSGATNVDGDPRILSDLLAEASAPPSSCQPHALSCLRSLALVSGDLHRDRVDSKKKESECVCVCVCVRACVCVCKKNKLRTIRFGRRRNPLGTEQEVHLTFISDCFIQRRLLRFRVDLCRKALALWSDRQHQSHMSRARPRAGRDNRISRSVLTQPTPHTRRPRPFCPIREAGPC